jgi:hypothetical protein
MEWSFSGLHGNGVEIMDTIVHFAKLLPIIANIFPISSLRIELLFLRTKTLDIQFNRIDSIDSTLFVLQSIWIMKLKNQKTR